MVFWEIGIIGEDSAFFWSMEEPCFRVTLSGYDYGTNMFIDTSGSTQVL